MRRVMIFDFDGVFVDSDTLKKRDAWFQIFPEEGDVPRAVLQEVLARIPETRFDILRELFRIVGKPIEAIDSLVTDYAARYNTAVQEGMLRLGLFPGVREGLEILSSRSRLYVSSATPAYGVRETVERLGIQSFFRDVLGRPASKEENVRTILARESITSAEAVCIGNGNDDLKAARAAGVLFVGITDAFNQWRGMPFPVVEGWKTLVPLLLEI